MPYKRRLMIITSVVLFSCLAVLFFLTKTYSGNEVDRRANDILAQMTLQQKVGQLFITSFNGQTSTEALFRLKKFHNGGFILFEDNVSDRQQLKNLISIIKVSPAALDIPAFISIDHEGGRVNRIISIIGHDRSSRDLVISGSPQKALEKGKRDARTLKGLGINLNFAPVLDVRTNAGDTMLGDRSFGDDPKLVSEFGIAYLKGLEARGIVGVVKHFPGHGSVSIDSHYALSTVTLSYSELELIDLKPFKDAIDQGAEGVMMGHLLVPALDSKWPSSISSKIIQDTLREEMGFRGLVFTDALNMGALKDFGPPGKLAILAINAGNDLLLADWSVSQEADAFESVLKAVRNGEISEDRIDESVKRIIEFKLKHFNKS